MLDLALLATFAAIAKSASFTAAARAVGRTQSAVSMQVRRLEAELGKTLLLRSAHGVRLTAHGHLLLHHAEAILAAERAARAAFAGQGEGGLVVLGLPEDYSPTLLPRILRVFRAACPGARLEIVCEESAALLRRLAERSVDLALVSAVVAGGGRGPVVYREPACWVAPRDGALHRADPLPLSLATDLDWYRRWVTEALDRQGRAYRIDFTSRSLTGVLGAVRAGLGITAVARSMVTADLRRLRPSDGFPALPLLDVRLERAHGTPTPLAAQLETALIERLPRSR